MRRSLLVGLAGVALATALLGYSSGAGSAGDQLARGRKLYQAGSYPSCALCHGMRSAAVTSPFSDDLDGTLLEDTRGKSRLGIERWVLGFIKNAQCFDPHDAARCMPRLLFMGKSAEDVAVFVATCGGHIGRPGCEPVPAFRGAAEAGFHDYQTLGCSSCHFGNLVQAIAPSLKGLAGSRVTLQSGETVVATPAYLLASILTPDRDTVKGFQYGLMASRIRPGDVTVAEARAIVAYLRTLS